MNFLTHVARRYGTPAYVYDLAEVRRSHSALTAALPESAVLYYSVKANPHPALIRQLLELGTGAEVSSTGELSACLEAGCPPQRVLLTGPAKSRSFLDQALAAGVREISVDSPLDLDRVADAARRAGTVARCILRVNADQPVPGMGMSMTGVASQFGADASWVLAEPERFADRPGASVAGLHLYMGSNLEPEGVLQQQFETALQVTANVGAALGCPLEVLDLGGGFAAPYARPGPSHPLVGIREHLSGLLDHGQPGWRFGNPRVVFESGRYLVGACGTLLATVMDVKVSKGRTFVVLDSGIHHLGGMAGLRRVPPVRVQPLAVREPAVDPISRGAVRESGAPRSSLVGPLCTPLDTWSPSEDLPELVADDVLAIPNVGAYGLTASLLGFLSHPAPVEVIVDGERIVGADQLCLTRRGAATAAT